MFKCNFYNDKTSLGSFVKRSQQPSLKEIVKQFKVHRTLRTDNYHCIDASIT